MKVRSLWCVILLASPAVAAAQGSSGHGSDAYLGVRFGSLGIGGELSKLLTGHIGARVGLNFFSASTTQTEKDISYAADLKLQAFTGLLDFYPANRGSFHLTGGVMTDPLKISATGQPSGSGTYTINHDTYTAAQVGTLTGTGKWGSALPYLGFGFGTAAGKHSGLKFVFDLGVGIGKPTVSLTSTGSVPGLQADLAAQQDTTQKSLNKIGVYPVLNLGLVYRF